MNPNTRQPEQSERPELCPVCDGMGGWDKSTGMVKSSKHEHRTVCPMCGGTGKRADWSKEAP